jgi:CDP-4-dehydro-6-deoxyglucose reductase
MKERILRFEGPHGTFYLREDSDKPIILLASGTGFAPIKALVEQLIHLKSERPVALYWGGRRPADLYRISYARNGRRNYPASVMCR